MAFSKGSRLTDALKEDEENINRKDLRYIVIENNLLHIYTSKRSMKDDDINESRADNNSNAVKVLKLSKEKKVEMNFISKRHGHSVIVTDMKTSRTVCTLLPVRLTSEYFRDEECSQVVGSKKFKKIRAQLFGTNAATVADQNAGMSRISDSTDPNKSPSGRPNQTSYKSPNKSPNRMRCLQDISNDNDIDSSLSPVQLQHRNSINSNSCSSWPLTMPQIAPEEQNTTALCLQFAIDAAMHK